MSSMENARQMYMQFIGEMLVRDDKKLDNEVTEEDSESEVETDNEIETMFVRSTSLGVDPTRSVAPHLTSEIISRILNFIFPPLKNTAVELLAFAPISRISKAWRVPALKRLFQTINIDSEKRLLKLDKIKRSGYFIYLEYLIVNLPCNWGILASCLYFILAASPNLKYFNFFPPETFGSPSQLKFMREKVNLPKLLVLKVHFENRHSKGNYQFLDSFVSVSKNLQTLELVNLFRSRTVENPTPFTSKLDNLKKLVLTKRNDVLYGRIWPVEQLKGLLILSAEGDMAYEYPSDDSDEENYELDYKSKSDCRIEDTMAIVGKSLVEYISDERSSDSIKSWVKLQRFTFIGSFSVELISNLPRSLIHLKNMAEGSGFWVPISTWSHLKKLRILELYEPSLNCDLSFLPRVNKLILTIVAPESFLESLQAVEPDQLTVKIVVCRKFKYYNDWKEDWDFKYATVQSSGKIRERCEELGIKLILERI